ncbi:hypothetical protein HBDW_35860 [Herbaspirillum sp. DW155]|uniref:hypothetical protein n=1 Tax=Herbaspirillum sp. DW155 TaxID=3095609 RepID=UPI00308C085E|nr:hypothetical protein HBDW_35860 [Herbaspirillum sp. DW155]
MNSPEPSVAAQNTPPPGRGRWVVVLLAAMLLTLLGLFWLYLEAVNASLWGFGPRELAIAQYTPKDVVGDLGGMKVVIPRGVAELVEYDDDPTWGEKRKGPRPVRTFDSRLASFGFYVRYPDGATFADPEMRKDYEKYGTRERAFNHGIRGGDLWLRPGVSSGKFYSRDGFLDRISVKLDAPIGRPWWQKFDKLPHKEHGLTVYRVKGIEAELADPQKKLDFMVKDVYIHRDKTGKVKTYIDCHPKEWHSSACKQSWSLEDDGVHAEVYVAYGPEKRKNWREIQKMITQTLLGFRAAPNGDASSTEPALKNL